MVPLLLCTGAALLVHSMHVSLERKAPSQLTPLLRTGASASERKALSQLVLLLLCTSAPASEANPPHSLACALSSLCATGMPSQVISPLPTDASASKRKAPSQLILPLCTNASASKATNHLLLVSPLFPLCKTGMPIWTLRRRQRASGCCCSSTSRMALFYMWPPMSPTSTPSLPRCGSGTPCTLLGPSKRQVAELLLLEA